MDNVIAALVGAIIGAAVAIVVSILQRQWAQEDKESDRQILRHSLRAVLRDEIDHSKELLRQYQGYLEAPEPGTFDMETVQYERLVTRPLDIWHAMWESQAQSLSTVLYHDEIVPTSRFHRGLNILIGQWLAMNGIRQKYDARAVQFLGKGKLETAQKFEQFSVEGEFYDEMRQPYQRFTEALQTLIDTPNPIGPGD